jgi:hypothetical protein
MLLRRVARHCPRAGTRYPDSHSHNIQHTIPDPYPDSADSHRHSYGHANLHSHADVDPHKHGDLYSHVHTLGYTYQFPHLYPFLHTHMDPDADHYINALEHFYRDEHPIANHNHVSHHRISVT